MTKKFFKNVEWQILIYCILLLVIGLVALYSATIHNGLIEFNKQIKWFLISIPILTFFTFVDYKKITKYSIIYYIISILLLIGVLYTKPINGSSSWYDLGELSFQPAEISKIFVILFISYVVSTIQNKGMDEINKIYKLVIPILVLLVPLGLILKQPDYGTGVAFIFAFVSIIYVSGIRKRYILPILLIGIIGGFVIWKYIIPVYAPHIIKRIDVFLNPGLDPRGAGYNVLQSKLAIGSGHVFGMGFMQGNQTQLGYLHPKTTDFIFAMISEELGFIVSGVIIILYVLLINKAIYISKTARDNMGSYISIGIAAIFLYHMLENIGMTMGILPITGIPLPFVSYGGSSLVTNFVLIGILLNVSGRRQKAIFVDIEKEKNGHGIISNIERKKNNFLKNNKVKN